MPRREFLRSSGTTGLLAGAAGWHALARLSAASAQEPAVTPGLVQLAPEIEPLVRRIEHTPRDRCFEMMVEQLRGGVGYRQFLAALFLAGIRNVNPQPPGFKFHCVFVIHSAHQLSLDAPVKERLLPLFWALDEFKKSQAEDERLGDFRLGPVQGELPDPGAAWNEFHQAMEAWDEERADRAIAQLARHRGAHEVIEGLWRYGARDFRNIGHKAIFVANAWRTLNTIGWRHAEPVLRSLVLGLLDFKHRESNGYAFENQSYLPNVERVKAALPSLRADWTRRDPLSSATLDLLGAMRHGQTEEACRLALEQLATRRAGAGAAWDAIHLAAGELMMRQPGIYGIHAVTSANALRYAFETCAEPGNGLLLLLQGVGWMCQFRNFMARRDAGLANVDITQLEPAELPARPEAAVEEIFGLVAGNPSAAAVKALALAQAEPTLAPFAEAARKLIFRKASDAHHYKYAAAILEDYALVSPAFRPYIAATSVYYLRGTGHPDSALLNRVLEALG